MPSLKEVKNRIASVQTTRKITSAMKMVASSKLHRAQQNIESMRPYEQGLNRMLTKFLAAEAGEVSTPLSIERPVQRAVIVAITSNSSLCGGFNANVIRSLRENVKKYEQDGVEIAKIVTIGKKAAEAVRNMPKYAEVAEDFSHLLEHPAYIASQKLSAVLMESFIAADFDEVVLIYHHFRSAASQILTQENLLPISLSALHEAQEVSARGKQAKKQDGAFALNFIIEPSREVILQNLIPKAISLKLYTALLDSLASEHAARVIAMQIATDNADELLRELRLTYNKTRQQAITTELLDIVGGSMQ